MNDFAFHSTDIPAASSMLRLASQLRKPSDRPQLLAQYMCTWVSFNNVYSNLWLKCRQFEQDRLATVDDPVCRYKPSLHLVDRKVDEESLVNHAFAHLSNDCKRALIRNASTSWFYNRQPMFRGTNASPDAQGRPCNGVVNVGYSRPSNIVCSRIDQEFYFRALGSDTDQGALDKCSNQVFKIVYTVRNNIFHGGKDAENEFDREVVGKALPLLELILKDFWADTSEWPGQSTFAEPLT